MAELRRVQEERDIYWAGIEYRSDLVMVISFSGIHEINRVKTVEEYNRTPSLPGHLHQLDRGLHH